MDACTYFYSYIGNYNNCASNCVVRKRNIYRDGLEYVDPLGILQTLAYDISGYIYIYIYIYISWDIISH